jgi:3-hydroxyisobutyrate dehydrogenase-like beta-hydroxyacid dehydrogenase
VEIIAESHVLAEKSGLSPSILEKLLELNFGSVAHSSSIRMTSGVYMPPPSSPPWSNLDLAIKDVGHGVDVARKAGVSLEVGETALEHLKRAKMYAEGEGGGRRLDSSALYGVVRQDSGLDFRTEFVTKRDREA